MEERVTLLRELHDTERKQHIRTILTAVQKYQSDTGGRLPAGISSEKRYICRSDVPVECTGLVNLSALTKNYLITLPLDPQYSSGASTGYRIFRENGNIILDAPMMEGGEGTFSAQLSL